MEFLLQASLHESAVPSFGNSKSTGVKQLNSAPRMTPEGQKFLSLGIASPSPAPRDLVKCQANSTVVAISPVHVPGKPLCARRLLPTKYYWIIKVVISVQAMENHHP
jgi:hypothetical protein